MEESALELLVAAAMRTRSCGWPTAWDGFCGVVELIELIRNQTLVKTFNLPGAILIAGDEI